MGTATLKEKPNKRKSAQKVFKATEAPKNLPKDCVTIDKFFSDLEDYIQSKNGRI